MSHPDTTSKDAVFQWRGIPQPGQLLPLGLQHVVAAVVGVITPAILIADTCGLSSADKTLMIQVSLILTALATLLQLFPIFHRIGSGLPVIMGISFAYIPTLQAIGGEFGLPTILGAEIVGGIVAIVFGVLVKWIRPLFPPLVTGTVIFTIGLSLYPTAVKYMAGGAGSEWFGSAKSWAVALITLAVVVFLNHFTKGITKLASILIGILAGYVIAYFLGIVDLSGVGSAAWVALPRPMPFDIQFVPAACVSLGIVYVVNAVQTIGDLSSTTMGGMDRMPTDKELSGGIVGQGVIEHSGRLLRRPARRHLQPERGHRHRQPGHQPGGLRPGGPHSAGGRAGTQVRLPADHHPPVRHWRRHHLGVRHHHHDRHPYDHRGGLHPPQELRGGPVGGLGRGDHPGVRLPGRRGLPRLGQHRVRLLLRGGGRPHGHPAQPDPAQGALRERLIDKRARLPEEAGHGIYSFDSSM